jgi:hypothetical protein
MARFRRGKRHPSIVQIGKPSRAKAILARDHVLHVSRTYPYVGNLGVSLLRGSTLVLEPHRPLNVLELSPDLAETLM